MIHTRTKIIALVSLGFFLGSLIMYGIFFWVVQGHKEELVAERLRAAEAKIQSEALSALEATVTASQEDRDTLHSFILGDEEIIDLLSLIELTAREQGVSLTTDSLTVNELDETFEKLRIAVSLKGTFDGVMRMLRIIENVPEQSSVPSISLTRYEEEGTMLWQGSIDIEVTKYKKI